MKFSLYRNIYRSLKEVREWSVLILVGRNIPDRGTTNAKDTRKDRAYHAQVASEAASGRKENHKILGPRDTGDLIILGLSTIKTWILF